jgi:hypothetical protein
MSIMKQYTDEHIRQILENARNEIELSRKHHKPIPRFSVKYATIADYLRGETASGRFNANSSTGRRILKAAQEHPTFYDINDARGHGKPTGKVFNFFDEGGEVQEGIRFKNRQEESKWASYLNAQKNYLKTGDDADLKKFAGKSFADSQGNKHEFVTAKELLTRLEKVGELPSGNDIYKH